MSAFAPVLRAIKFIKDNKERMFWLWIAYQAIKGTTTLTLIWIPLFLLWRQGAGADVTLKDWVPFIAAMILFPLSHALLANPRISQLLKGVLGDKGFRAAFSVLSLGLLGWLIWEAVRAPVVPLWTSEPWQHALSVALITLGLILIVFGTAIPNPVSIFSNGAPFNPDKPGVLRLTRHPVLFGLFFWGAGHVIANGTFALVIFFGSQALFALLGALIMDRRAKRVFPDDDWNSIAAGTSFWPNPIGLVRGVDNLKNLVVRWIITFLLVATLIALHPVILGVSPLALITGS